MLLTDQGYWPCFSKSSLVSSVAISEKDTEEYDPFENEHFLACCLLIESNGLFYVSVTDIF